MKINWRRRLPHNRMPYSGLYGVPKFGSVWSRICGLRWMRNAVFGTPCDHIYYIVAHAQQCQSQYLVRRDFLWRGHDIPIIKTQRRRTDGMSAAKAHALACYVSTMTTTMMMNVNNKIDKVRLAGRRTHINIVCVRLMDKVELERKYGRYDSNLSDKNGLLYNHRGT